VSDVIGGMLHISSSIIVLSECLEIDFLIAKQKGCDLLTRRGPLVVSSLVNWYGCSHHKSRKNGHDSSLSALI
jgi:hypothetical protein